MLRSEFADVPEAMEIVRFIRAGNHRALCMPRAGLRQANPMTPNSAAKLGIFAGGGDLPLKLAEACRAQGRGLFLIGIEGSAGAEIESFPHAWAGIGAIARTHKLSRTQAAGRSFFAGIVRRPDFRKLKPDRKGAVLLTKILAAAAQRR